MRRLDEVAGQELLWMPAKAVKKSYELRAGEEILGTLTWQRGSLAAADFADDHWTFKREGFWHPRVTIRVAGSETDQAIFRPGWSGAGTLELSPTRHIKWGAASMWHSQWNWQETDSRPLVHFKSHQGWTKQTGTVEVAPAAVSLSELSLLVSLGWYLLVLLAQDTTAATVAATTVATTTT
jgi:hypothetical protein